MKLALKTPGDFNLQPVAGMPDGGVSTLQYIVRWGTTMLLITAIILTLFFLIWGGIEWITSGGNKEKLAGAQKKVIFAGIGLIISLGAFMIINIVGGFFGVSFF